jgi:hypothetical protein
MMFQIMAFDSCGVSGHPNHCDVYHGIRSVNLLNTLQLAPYHKNVIKFYSGIVNFVGTSFFRITFLSIPHVANALFEPE